MLVAHAGPDWLGEIFEVRREIGALVAARAATGADDDARRRLRDLLDQVAGAADADAAQLAECELHRVLAAATGNRVYGLLVNSLLNAYEEVRGLFRAPFSDPKAAADRLAPLVATVCAGDPAAAHAAAEEYLALTGQLMLGE